MVAGSGAQILTAVLAPVNTHISQAMAAAFRSIREKGEEAASHMCARSSEDI